MRPASSSPSVLDLALAAAARNVAALDPIGRQVLVTVGANAAIAGQINCAEGMAALDEASDDPARDSADRLPPSTLCVGAFSADDAKGEPGARVDVPPRPAPLIVHIAHLPVGGARNAAVMGLAGFLVSGGRLRERGA